MSVKFCCNNNKCGDYDNKELNNCSLTADVRCCINTKKKMVAFKDPTKQQIEMYKSFLSEANERDQENEKMILGYQTIIKNKYKIIARQKTWIAILAVAWLASLAVNIILGVSK